MHWEYHDGGRSAAGYKGTTGDCVARALAIAEGIPYQDAYAAVNACAASESTRQRGWRSSARTGVAKDTTRRVFAERGWTWVPVMQIGTGCTMHVREDELPPGRIIVKLSRHVAAVLHGVVYDTYDPSRGGTRCVYGYWMRP